MAPRGGFAELTDAELRTLVDYMLAAAGHANTPMNPVSSADSRRNTAAKSAPTPVVASAPTQAVRAAPPQVTASIPRPAADSPVDLATALALRLRAVLGKPDMRLDPDDGVITIRSLEIKVQAQDGVATLSGAVQDASLISRAETLAASTPGVRQVINRIIAGAMLDFD